MHTFDITRDHDAVLTVEPTTLDWSNEWTDQGDRFESGSLTGSFLVEVDRDTRRRGRNTVHVPDLRRADQRSLVLTEGEALALAADLVAAVAALRARDGDLIGV